MFISDDDQEKMEWLVKRIMEIQAAYGRFFPTLAIFMKNDMECMQLEKKLKHNEGIEAAGLNVVACLNGNVLGDKQSIRIFGVEYIKGLEFGAVFFWDLDSLSDSDDELFNKYMYVGLSRANLFLGVILNEAFSDDLSYLTPLFEEGGWDLKEQYSQISN